MIYVNLLAPVAQLDRAYDYGSELYDLSRL